MANEPCFCVPRPALGPRGELVSFPSRRARFPRVHNVRSERCPRVLRQDHLADVIAPRGNRLPDVSKKESYTLRLQLLKALFSAVQG